MQKRFINTKELAEYLSLSEDAIRAWVKIGYIPFSKFGRAVRFDLQRIDSWVKTKECPYIRRNFP